jgi:hypothetical protein
MLNETTPSARSNSHSLPLPRGGSRWGLLLATVLTIALFARVHAEPPKPPPTTQPAAGQSESKTESPELEPPREPSPAEILRELSKATNTPARIVRPSSPGETVVERVKPEDLPPNAIVPVAPKLYPDGWRLVDRPGRLTREGDYYTFSFETRTEGSPDLPIRLLPNRLLEDMEIASAGGTKPVVFIVSGELTEYHGVNYLLVQKLLTRPNLGNFK